MHSLIDFVCALTEDATYNVSVWDDTNQLSYSAKAGRHLKNDWSEIQVT